ncbi:glycosyltransferase [Moorena producens JHB]|uniref:Glycosyltransferase n=1 Tax=Moorena producens (strain JHB) TaxID=1454205 RepID=A0A1D9FY44_MOOP1|nr:glycosyltransferase [Moorena producens]AOY80289.1 glycosyltransferase [Moorena producens JHB]
MRIAICSLSQFTYVAEFIDVAQRLNEKHEVCYFLGFHCSSAINLLQNKHLPYQVLNKGLETASILTTPATAKSTYDLFKGYFFKYAELVLPDLLKAFKHWKPDLILSHLRDYTGITAAEIINKPVLSFGSHTSPLRVETIDPPFGSRGSRDTPKGLLKIWWELHNKFNDKVDRIYNHTIRQPYGLSHVYNTSTLHSNRLVLLSIISALSNKQSQDPPHIKYLGSLLSRKLDAAPAKEIDLIARISSMPKPRVFVSLGTTYVTKLLLEKCIKALIPFTGTVIVSLGRKTDLTIPSLLDLPHIIWNPFFFDVDSVLKLSDVIVTVGGGKSVMDSLSVGKPLICLPQQGEQWEIALALQSLGAAEIPCPRKWDGQTFTEVTEQVATESKYTEAAALLQSKVEQSGGVEEAVKAIEAL